MCSFEVFATVITYKNFFYNFRGFHFIRKLFIHWFFYRNILRFLTCLKYFFYNFSSFCFISRLFILSFFHRNLVRFVNAILIYPCFFSSHLTWRFLLPGQELLNSSLLNRTASMSTASLNRKFCFELGSVWKKARHFSTKSGSLRQRSHYQSQWQKPTFCRISFCCSKGHFPSANLR